MYGSAEQKRLSRRANPNPNPLIINGGTYRHKYTIGDHCVLFNNTACCVICPSSKRVDYPFDD